MPDPSGSLEERLAVVERLSEIHRPERIAYLIITILALIALLVCAGIVIWRQGLRLAELSVLFGSSGLITFSCGRILLMWSRAMDVIFRLGASAEEQP